jgi:hypothetical protein
MKKQKIKKFAVARPHTHPSATTRVAFSPGAKDELKEWYRTFGYGKPSRKTFLYESSARNKIDENYALASHQRWEERRKKRAR